MAISIGDSGSQNWRWHITIVGKGANVNVVQRRIASSYKNNDVAGLARLQEIVEKTLATQTGYWSNFSKHGIYKINKYTTQNLGEMSKNLGKLT